MKKTFTQNRKGQALVETAFILFIIVLFSFGITEFGRAMYIKNMLNNAARAGARQAVVTGTLAPLTYNQNAFTNCTVPSTDSIKDKICSGLMYVGDKSTISATVTCTAALGGACAANAATGDTIIVEVRENNFRSFVPNLIPITNILVGRASMRYE